MIDKQPHIVLKVYGDVDLDFALVPATESMVEAVVECVGSLQVLDSFVQAEFWNGCSVFFERPDGLEQVTDEEYKIVAGRPDIHWRHFKKTDRIRLVIQRNGNEWKAFWRADRESSEFDTSSVPVTVIAALGNPYLEPEGDQFAELADGTPLYPAYDHPRPGECHRRALGSWNGATGEWIGVTLDGRLFRQRQSWGGERPRPGKWQQFRLGGA